MMINNNVYTFLSGILVSLSINIFTSLCFEKGSFCSNWFLYLASVIFLLTSALCMHLAAKISKFQNYIIEKRIIDYESKQAIVIDATKQAYIKWIVLYACIFLMSFSGIILLAFNFTVNK